MRSGARYVVKGKYSKSRTSEELDRVLQNFAYEDTQYGDPNYNTGVDGMD